MIALAPKTYSCSVNTSKNISENLFWCVYRKENYTRNK
jgi:hypothetical protein